MRCPQVRIDKEDKALYTKDRQVVSLELLFTFLSVLNILVLYYLMSTVIPFPITVTWCQFAVSLLFARVLGECGKEYPNLAYFVPVKIHWEEVRQLAFPTVSFICMILLGNILLAKLPAVALFPITVSFAVVSHHVTRFFGCGQAYRPFRWGAMGLILAGFVISCFDLMSTRANAIGLALAYGVAATAYRACFLERAMHVVKGLGNNLHNEQSLIAVITLPFLIFFTRERRFFTYMPDDFSKGYTYLMWGCLVTAAVLPFTKNIVANRLIRLGGQPPWRFLELVSMILIFALGWIIFDRVSTIGAIAFLVVLTGRTMNTLDALSVESQIQRPAELGPRLRNRPQSTAAHGSVYPATLDHSNPPGSFPANPDGKAYMELPTSAGLGDATVSGVPDLSRNGTPGDPRTSSNNQLTSTQNQTGRSSNQPPAGSGIGDATVSGVPELSQFGSPMPPAANGQVAGQQKGLQEGLKPETLHDGFQRTGMDTSPAGGLGLAPASPSAYQGLGGSVSSGSAVESPSGGMSPASGAGSGRPSAGIGGANSGSEIPSGGIPEGQVLAVTGENGAGANGPSPSIPSGGVTDSLSPAIGVKDVPN